MNDRPFARVGSLFLDEGGLQSGDVNLAFQGLSELLRVAAQDGMKPFKHSEVYRCSVDASGTELLDVLFRPGTIEEDVRQALIAQIDALEDWDTSDALQRVATQTTRDVAAQLVRDGGAAACIVFPDCRSAASDRGVFILVDSSELEVFYRTLPTILELNEDDFIQNCKRAYRLLYFRPGIAGDIRRFSRPYSVMRPLLVEALRDLNDTFATLLQKEIEPAQLSARFAAASRFEVSGESSRTRRNRDAMRERDVDLDGKTFRCLWHLKIEPTRDRIHFHQFDAAVGNGEQLLIGLFCEHLTT